MLYPKSFAAVFTRVKNEKYMFPLWLRYYSRYFAGRDMYVLDNDTTDGSLDDGGFQRIIMSHKSAWDDPWMTRMVCKCQRELLRNYRYVIYTDVDEFIVPDPRKYRDLIHYIQLFQKDCVQCMAYTVAHDFDNEPPLDFNKPVLSQRSRWAYMGAGWGKTSLARIPLDWSVGQHDCVQNKHRDIDNDLYLVHLSMLDVPMCQQRRIDRSVGFQIGHLSGRHVLDTDVESIHGHERHLLKCSTKIPEFMRAVVI